MKLFLFLYTIEQSNRRNEIHITFGDFNINPFQANVPILYLLKTPENQRFSAVFQAV